MHTPLTAAGDITLAAAVEQMYRLQVCLLGAALAGINRTRKEHEHTIFYHAEK